jgi:hypothetical protein
MKRTSIVSIVAESALFLLLAIPPTLFGDDHDKKTDITIDRPVQVPGAVLQPGTYMFTLMNVTGDRHVVEVRSEDGKTLYATAFTAAAQRIERTGKVVLTYYEMPKGAPDAVRGDFEGQAFLYPRQKAAEITGATHQRVPEAPDQDPAKVLGDRSK